MSENKSDMSYSKLGFWIWPVAKISFLSSLMPCDRPILKYCSILLLQYVATRGHYIYSFNSSVKLPHCVWTQQEFMCFYRSGPKT